MRLFIKDIKHWRFKFELMRFGILLLVVVLFWVGIELYTTYSNTTIPEDYTEEIKPLNPALDLDVLDQLERRVDAPEEFEIVLPDDVETSPQSITTPPPTERPTNQASSSGESVGL